MKGLFVFLLSLNVLACAQSQNSTTQAQSHSVDPAKYLIESNWYPRESPNWQLDFTGVVLGTPSSITWNLGDGGSCASMAIVTAEQTSTLVEGEMVIINYYTLAVSGSVSGDLVNGMPPCSMFDGNYTAVIQSGILYLTGADGVLDTFE